MLINMVLRRYPGADLDLGGPEGMSVDDLEKKKHCQCQTRYAAMGRTSPSGAQAPSPTPATHEPSPRRRRRRRATCGLRRRRLCRNQRARQSRVRGQLRLLGRAVEAVAREGTRQHREYGRGVEKV